MNKNLSVTTAVVAIAIMVLVVFPFQKVDTSFVSKQTISTIVAAIFNFNFRDSKTKLPSNVSSQIRTLNNTLNEYNTYNNAAKQMNTSNNPL